MRKLLSTSNRSMSEVAKEEGISEPRLYNWRKQPKNEVYQCQAAKNRQKRGHQRQSWRSSRDHLND
ncbi:transposase [endosymbiont of Ridgeia piscesae]|uniref:transposase n=2 Tax=endosymbiont of Ridgeia piscesae TaxID=54398 RepID=UPI0012F968E6